MAVVTALVIQVAILVVVTAEEIRVAVTAAAVVETVTKTSLNTK